MEIGIFDKNWDFSMEIGIFRWKLGFFDENLNISSKFEYFMKIWIFDENWDFWWHLEIWIFDENWDFWRKFVCVGENFEFLTKFCRDWWKSRIQVKTRFGAGSWHIYFSRDQKNFWNKSNKGTRYRAFEKYIKFFWGGRELRKTCTTGTS